MDEPAVLLEASYSFMRLGYIAALLVWVAAAAGGAISYELGQREAKGDIEAASRYLLSAIRT